MPPYCQRVSPQCEAGGIAVRKSKPAVSEELRALERSVAALESADGVLHVVDLDGALLDRLVYARPFLSADEHVRVGTALRSLDAHLAKTKSAAANRCKVTDAVAALRNWQFLGSIWPKSMAKLRGRSSTGRLVSLVGATDVAFRNRAADSDIMRPRNTGPKRRSRASSTQGCRVTGEHQPEQTLPAASELFEATLQAENCAAKPNFCTVSDVHVTKTTIVKAEETDGPTDSRAAAVTVVTDPAAQHSRRHSPPIHPVGLALPPVCTPESGGDPCEQANRSPDQTDADGNVAGGGGADVSSAKSCTAAEKVLLPNAGENNTSARGYTPALRSTKSAPQEVLAEKHKQNAERDSRHRKAKKTTVHHNRTSPPPAISPADLWQYSEANLPPLHLLPEFIAMVHSTDRRTWQHGLRIVSSLMNVDDEPNPVDAVLESDILPRLVSFLTMSDHAAFVAHALNILGCLAAAYGTENCTRLRELDLIRPLVQLLDSPADAVFGGSVFVLQSMTGGGPIFSSYWEYAAFCKELRSLGAMEVLLSAVKTRSLSEVTQFGTAVILTQLAPPPVTIDVVDVALSCFEKMISCPQFCHASHLMWMLGGLTAICCNSEVNIQRVIDANFLKIVMRSLTINDVIAQCRAATVVDEMIASGSDHQRQVLVDAGLLYSFGVLLSHQEEEIRIIACRILDRLSSNTAHLQAIIALKLVSFVAKQATMSPHFDSCADYDFFVKAVLAGEHDQICALYVCGALDCLQAYLSALIQSSLAYRGSELTSVLDALNSGCWERALRRRHRRHIRQLHTSAPVGNGGVWAPFV